MVDLRCRLVLLCLRDFGGFGYCLIVFGLVFVMADCGLLLFAVNSVVVLASYYCLACGLLFYLLYVHWFDLSGVLV